MEKELVFAKRLRQMRKKRQLSMEALSSRMSKDCAVSKQAISKYESGVMMPNESVIDSLADALKVSKEYFFKPFSFDIDTFQLSFRKKKNIKSKDIETLKIDIQERVEKYLEIEDILGIHIEVPNTNNNSIISSRQEIEEKAKNLRKSWKLGASPIVSVQNLLEFNGVKVIYEAGPDGFDGVSGWANGKSAIVVLNCKNDNIERRRFTALHELAHIFFNRNFNPDLSENDKEKLCHAFASEMLLPQSQLRLFLRDRARIPIQDLVALQSYYGISVDAIMYKMRTSGQISESRYRNYCIRKRSSKALCEYLDKSRFEENNTDRYQLLVIQALSSQLITREKAHYFLKGEEETTINNNVQTI